MELDKEMLKKLISAAREAQSRAYCPYSHFPVGAAVLTDRGRIVAGCNVENASFGLTICAERNALTRCVAEGAGRPDVILIVGTTDEPLTPCGACRQFMWEFNPGMRVICADRQDKTREFRLSDLLPFAFGGGDLESGS